MTPADTHEIEIALRVLADAAGWLLAGGGVVLIGYAGWRWLFNDNEEKA